MSRLCSLLFVLGLVMLPSLAHASSDQANLYFEIGVRYFKLASYAQAIEEFQRAYRIQPAPNALFMIGQSYRNLGHYRRAIEAFRQYLKAKPDAPERIDLEQLIAELEKKKDAPSASLSKPISIGSEDAYPPSTRSALRPAYKKWWFWTALTGAAVIALGAGFGIGYAVANDSEARGSLGSVDLR
jgi:tetratricopeptide (TPR) repeat protein